MTDLMNYLSRLNAHLDRTSPIELQVQRMREHQDWIEALEAKCLRVGERATLDDLMGWVR